MQRDRVFFLAQLQWLDGEPAHQTTSKSNAKKQLVVDEEL